VSNALGEVGKMIAGFIVAAAAESDDLAGNWDWTVWLLIPLVLVLAYVTARSVGPQGEPPRSESSSRGVSQYLTRHAESEKQDQ
jgi:hypothetical protein